MKIITNNGIIDTNKIYFICIQKSNQQINNFCVKAYSGNKEYEFPQTYSTNMSVVNSKFKSIIKIINENEPNKFILMDNLLINKMYASVILKNYIRKTKNIEFSIVSKSI